MVMRSLVLFALLNLLAGMTNAENIEGTIVIKQKLTKRRVTATIPLYQRGTVVSLNADNAADPLAFERSRVVVYLEGRSPAAPVTAKMEQQDRRFLQDPVVIPVGSKVSFPNLDPIFHNVFSLSKAKMFDLGNYSRGETRVVSFLEPGVVMVHCHLHPNMSSAIVVTPNRFYAKVDPSGHFSIPDVPPGKYTVVAWHKAAGSFRKTIELTAGRNSNVDFLLPLDDVGNVRQEK